MVKYKSVNNLSFVNAGKKKSWVFSILLLVALIAVSANVFVFESKAAVTKYINYQGKLTDNLGNPVVDGPYTIRFRIYNHATNDAANPCNPGVNSCLWEETKVVTTTSGLFTSYLGDSTGFVDTNLLNYNGASYYLGVLVTGDTEMTPRKRISGALYALNSDRLGGKQESAFADLGEAESISGHWTFANASTDIQNTLYTDQVFVDVGGTNVDLESTATPTTSGAFAIGVNDEFTHSNSLNVQDVLDDLDAAIPAGGVAPANATYLVNSADPTLTNEVVVSALTANLAIQGDDAASRTITLGQTGAFNDLVVIDAGNWSVDAAGNSSFSGNLTTTAGDLIVGTTGLSETTAPNDSGAYLVGAFDEFTYSASTNVQAVLNDLDAALGAIDLFTDGGATTYRTDTADNFAIGAASLAAPFSVNVGQNTVRLGSGAGTNSHLIMYDNAGASGDMAYGSDAWTYSGGSINYLFGATQRLNIDASSTTHTDTQGVINIDLTSDTSFVSAIDVKTKSSAGLSAGAYPFGFKSHLVPNSGDSGSAARIGFYSDVASDEALVAGDFKSQLIGYMFLADPAFSNQILGTSPVIGYLSQINSASTGLATGFSAQMSKSNVGNVFGIDNSVNTSALGSGTGINNNIYHTGTGNAFGINSSVQSASTVGSLYGEDYSVTANAGFGGTIFGSSTTMVNNSAAAAGDLTGSYISITNSGGSSINDIYGAHIVIDDSGTSALSYGVSIGNVGANYLDYLMYLGGNAHIGVELISNIGIGIDLDNATIATADVRLSQGTQLIDLGASTLSFNSRLVPATPNTYDIGASPDKWRNGYFSGTVYAGSTLQLSDSGITDTNSNLILTASGSNYVDIQDTLYVDGLQSDGDALINGDLTGTGDLGTAVSPWPAAYVTTLNSANGINSTGDTTFVLGATDKVLIDASSDLHAAAGSGALQINYRSNTSSGDALLVNVDTAGTSGQLVHGVSTNINTRTGDNTQVRGYELQFTDNAATSDLIGMILLGNKTNSGPFYGVQSNVTHSGSGDLAGSNQTLTHSGTGDIYGEDFSINQSGTGLLYGSLRDLNSGASSVNDSFDQYVTMTHSGSFADFTGYYLDMTHDTTAAGTGTVSGLDITIRNQATVQDAFGINLTMNNSSNPTGDEIGMKITASSAIDSFIALSNAAQFGIDMDNASFSSYDIRLSDGEYIKNDANDTIELGGRVNIPAYTANPLYELKINHTNSSNGVGGIQVDLTNTTGVTYGIYSESDSADTGSAAGLFNATSSGRGLMATSSSGWAAYFSGGEGVYVSKLSVGDTASPDYNTIGTGAASHTAAGEIEDTSDLFIADDLEVNGYAWLDGGYTDVAEYIIVTENGVDRHVQHVQDGSIRKTDLAGAIIIADSTHPDKATLSSTPYDKRIIGIIATNPSLIISGGIDDDYGYPLVLAGRIHTNVCGENGDIEIGDFITTSSKPGFGMKATEPGMVVGQALESFSGAPGDCAQILVFQNIGWYHNAAGFVSNSVTFGLESVSEGDFSATPVYGGGDLRLSGSLYGPNNKWMIDEDGAFTVKQALPGGAIMDLYALMSPQQEMMFSGQGRLIDGRSSVNFDQNISQIIEDGYKVVVTPTNECEGLMVLEKSVDGFLVKELNQGTSSATFDWLVMASRSSSVAPLIEPEELDLIQPDHDEPASDDADPSELSEPEAEPDMPDDQAIASGDWQPLVEPIIEDENPASDDESMVASDDANPI
ncbi:MAG: beta strand repeat-containing protein [Patescibacteria group bacterium]